MKGLTEGQLDDRITNAVKNVMEGFNTSEPKSNNKIVVPSEMRKELKHLDKTEVNFLIGRVMRCLVGGGGTAAGAKRWSTEVLGDGEDSVVQKLLIVGSDPSGGFIVPDELSTIFIELLLPYAVVRGMNPTTMPMPAGNMTLNAGDTGPSASYIGEVDAIPVSSATFKRVNLSAKKLVGMVPISNDLIRTSSPQADAIVARWLLKAVANREDLAFIRGDGSANTPTGLRYLAGLERTMTGTGTVANVAEDLSALKLYMRNANLTLDNPGYLMSPRTEDFLWRLQDPITGFYPYREQIDAGRLGPYPIGVTTQIPDNLGGGTESELYFANFADVIIGDTMSVQMDSSTEASYVDGSVTRSAYQNDLTLLRAITAHDIDTQYVEAVTVLKALTWGA